MSPEPTHALNQDNLDTTNLNVGTRIITDSDSEDEELAHEGYMPLPDTPNDNEPMMDDDSDEEEEWTSAPPSSDPATCANSQISPPETIQVWSSLSSQSSIDLDAEKICQVKSLMASFTLPNSVIPEWASTISEDQWKEQLMGRITEMQKTEK